MNHERHGMERDQHEAAPAFERDVADVFFDMAPSHAPDHLLQSVIYNASRRRKRPRWLALIKEPPMRISDGVAVGSPTARILAVTAATLLLTLALVGAGVAGSRLLAADGVIIVDPSGDGMTTTITEAIAMAQDGDTVLVRPGTYTEALRIEKDITLRGDGADPSDVVIAVPADAPLADEEHAGRCLMGCSGTINGKVGIYLVETSSTITDLMVVGVIDGWAVLAVGGAPTLEDLVIDVGGPVAETTLTENRTGLQIDLGSNAVVRGITHEGWLGIDRGSSPVFEENQLLDTCVVIWGEGTNAEFRNNTVSGCPNGWAFDIGHGATPLIEDNDISAGGFDVYRGTVEGTDPVIRGNRIHAGERGIDIGSGATATIEGNEIFDVGRGISADQTGAHIADNDIHDNLTGVRLSGGEPSLEGNRITGNGIGLSLFSPGEGFVVTANTICDNGTNLTAFPESLEIDGANEVCEDPSAG